MEGVSRFGRDISSLPNPSSRVAMGKTKPNQKKLTKQIII